MILGIESSCDESALALFSAEEGLVGEWVHSQVSKHVVYGGVVPDVAVREHLIHFFPLFEEAEKEYRLRECVTCIAVTFGPGLAGCLAVGLSLAKTLGLLWDVPVLGVNHLRGHAFSPFLSTFDGNRDVFSGVFPHLGLLVSGGNTVLFHMTDDRSIEVVAETMDDAAGEALDKGAKLLGIAYPGGAELEKRAIGGNASAFTFPHAFPERREMRFSFSGLKTSILYTLNKMSDEGIRSGYTDLCSSYQAAAMEQLVAKTRHALEMESFASLGLSGGVANNKLLRSMLGELAGEREIPFLAADSRHTGDNAAMIAFAAHVDEMGAGKLESELLTFQPSLRVDQVV